MSCEPVNCLGLFRHNSYSTHAVFIVKYLQSSFAMTGCLQFDVLRLQCTMQCCNKMSLYSMYTKRTYVCRHSIQIFSSDLKWLITRKSSVRC